MWKVIRTALLAIPLPAFPAWLTYQSTSDVFPVVVGTMEMPLGRIILTSIFYFSLFYAVFKSIARLDKRYDRVSERSTELEGRVSDLEQENGTLRARSGRLEVLEASISEFQAKLTKEGRVDLAIQLGFHVSRQQADLPKENTR